MIDVLITNTRVKPVDRVFGATLQPYAPLNAGL